MTTAKKNKDGLIGGKLVSEKDHLAITTKKRTDKMKAARRKAEEKVINPTRAAII
jgi:hypothetical protein